MKSNLQQYFKENQDKGIFDHHVRATDDGDKVIIYIHPQNTDGETLDFAVTGNELKQLYNDDCEVEPNTNGLRFYINKFVEGERVKEVLKELKEIQSKEGTIDQGDYMVGLYNGLELSIAIIEGREPIYRNCDTPTIE